MDTFSKVNSLGIDFDGLSTLGLIHHFPETHQLPLCHINFLRMTPYVTWMKGISCQNDLRKQASKALHEALMGPCSVEYWPFFPKMFHLKKYGLRWKIHILHVKRIKASQAQKSLPYTEETIWALQGSLFSKIVGNCNSTFLCYSKIMTYFDKCQVIRACFLFGCLVMFYHVTVVTNPTFPFLPFQSSSLTLFSVLKFKEANRERNRAGKSSERDAN